MTLRSKLPSNELLFILPILMLGATTALSAERVEVPDPSIMLALVPAAADAKAPPCIKPGTRLTFFGMSASIPGEYKQLVQDENGNWVDKNTGQRYGQQDIPSASGAGYSVVHIGHVGDKIVQLSTKLYTLDTTTNRYMFSVGGGLVAHAGCAADYWIHPDVLKQVQQVNSQGVKILRMPYTVKGKTYKAIRFQSENKSGYNAQVYDLDTGLLVYHGSRTQGAPVYTPPIGGSGTAGIGRGSTQLVSGWIEEVKEIDVPWKNAPVPEWVGSFNQLSYTGVQRTSMPMAGSMLDRPMMTTITPKTRGDKWVRFTTSGTIQSLYGMPPEQSQQDGACGNASIAGLWIPPRALANLSPQQVIERHDLTGTTIAVSNVGQGAVTISETGPLHRIDSSYNASTGMLSAATLTQQIGMATISHSIRLAGQD